MGIGIIIDTVTAVPNKIIKDPIINLVTNKQLIQNPVTQFQPIVEIECI
jgi:hypothetical protein